MAGTHALRLLTILVLLCMGCAHHDRTQDAADRAEIIALASQYAWGVDSLDRALLARTFHAEASAHYLAVGPNPMNLDVQLEGIDAIFDWLYDNLQQRKGHAALPMHFVSNPLVELRGDTASLRFYMHNRAGSAGGAYYVETARYPEGWRFKTFKLEEQTWDASAYENDENAQKYMSGGLGQDDDRSRN
jgi:hypothetical protein